MAAQQHFSYSHLCQLPEKSTPKKVHFKRNKSANLCSNMRPKEFIFHVEYTDLRYCACMSSDLFVVVLTKRHASTVCVCVCRMASLSEQLQDVRSQAELCLYSGGRVVDLRAGVVAMANLPLPPCSKYHHIAAETMVIENSFGRNRKEVRKINCMFISPIWKYV